MIAFLLININIRIINEEQNVILLKEFDL